MTNVQPVPQVLEHSRDQVPASEIVPPATSDLVEKRERVSRRRSLGEIGRELKRQIEAGQNVDALTGELLELALAVANDPMPDPNRYIVEIPDRFAVARWSREADVATIARCILGTLKYEPHAADTTALRRALEGVIRSTQKEDAA
jgi:hypothetical protein